jgi:hypothetical protein
MNTEKESKDTANINQLISNYFKKKYVDKELASVMIKNKNNHDYNTLLYRRWTELPSGRALRSAHFPAHFSKTVAELPSGVQDLYLGQNFRGNIRAARLPRSLRKIYFRNSNFPVVKNIGDRKNIRFFRIDELSDRANEYNYTNYMMQKKNPTAKSQIADELRRDWHIDTAYDRENDSIIVSVYTVKDLRNTFEVIYERPVDRLLVYDAESRMDQLPPRFGMHLKWIELYLPVFDAELPRMPDSCVHLDLYMPMYGHTAPARVLPDFPPHLAFLKLNLKNYTEKLADFPAKLETLHLRLKNYTRALPALPSPCRECTLELGKFRGPLPQLPGGLQHFCLRNIREREVRRNINANGNYVNTRDLERFASMIHHFPASLVDIELPMYYRYPLPQSLLETISKDSRIIYNVYGSSDANTIAILSKEKLAHVLAEQMHRLRKQAQNVHYNVRANRDVLQEIKQTVEMYTGVEYHFEEGRLLLNEALALRYIDYKILGTLPAERLEVRQNKQAVEWDSRFTIDIDVRAEYNFPIRFPMCQHLVIFSNAFNSPFVDVARLTSLEIVSDAFNQPLRRAVFPSLLNLQIRSKAFNEAIEAENLWDLSIESDAFNVPIRDLGQLTRLRVVSPMFNEPITNAPNLVELTIDARDYDKSLEHLVLNRIDLNVHSYAGKITVRNCESVRLRIFGDYDFSENLLGGFSSLLHELVLFTKGEFMFSRIAIPESVHVLGLGCKNLGAANEIRLPGELVVLHLYQENITEHIKNLAGYVPGSVEISCSVYDFNDIPIPYYNFRGRRHIALPNIKFNCREIFKFPKCIPHFQSVEINTVSFANDFPRIKNGVNSSVNCVEFRASIPANLVANRMNVFAAQFLAPVFAAPISLRNFNSLHIGMRMDTPIIAYLGGPDVELQNTPISEPIYVMPRSSNGGHVRNRARHNQSLNYSGPHDRLDLTELSADKNKSISTHPEYASGIECEWNHNDRSAEINDSDLEKRVYIDESLYHLPLPEALLDVANFHAGMIEVYGSTGRDDIFKKSRLYLQSYIVRLNKEFQRAQRKLKKSDNYFPDAAKVGERIRNLLMNYSGIYVGEIHRDRFYPIHKSLKMTLEICGEIREDCIGYQDISLLDFDTVHISQNAQRVTKIPTTCVHLKVNGGGGGGGGGGESGVHGRIAYEHALPELPSSLRELEVFTQSAPERLPSGLLLLYLICDEFPQTTLPQKLHILKYRGSAALPENLPDSIVLLVYDGVQPLPTNLPSKLKTIRVRKGFDLGEPRFREYKHERIASHE